MKTLMRILFAAAVGLAAVAAVGAQSYSVPDPVPGAGGGSFRPFGWSADGKFAWLMVDVNDGRGDTVYSYVIYDAVEDSIVYKHLDDTTDWGEDTQPSEAESWKRSGADVSSALQKAGIVQASGIRIEPFPLRRSGDTYSASIKVENIPDTEEGDDVRVQAYAVTVTSASRGSKVVTRKDKLRIAGAEVAGFIRSPSEPRILVVVNESSRGFEGYNKKAFFYGASLLVGFRK